jgi:hypothetical protein
MDSARWPAADDRILLPVVDSCDARSAATAAEDALALAGRDATLVRLGLVPSADEGPARAG